MSRIPYDKDEKIIKVLRRYPLAIIIESVLLALAVIAPYVIYRTGLLSHILYYQDISFLFGGHFVYFIMYAYSIWVLGLFILFSIAWSDYSMDTWIITDGRVIDVKQRSTFKRQINTYRFDNMREVIVLNQNWFQKIFGYGSIEIITLGESKKFHIAEVYNPDAVKSMIVSLQKEGLEKMRSTVSVIEDPTF